MRRGFQSAGLIIVCCLSMIVPLAAQGGFGKGRLMGVVLDDEGRPLPSAKVVLRFVGKWNLARPQDALRKTESAMFETKSDEDGKWSRNNITGGWWNISASRDGYHSANRDCFVRELSQNPKVELRLAKVPGPEYKSTPSILEKANDLFFLKKYDEALAAYREYLKTDPTNTMAALNVAYCLQDKGDLEAAIAEFEAVAKQTSKDARDAYLTGRTYAGIAECHHQRKDETNAKAFFIKALDAFPNDELWAYNVGEIAYGLGDMDEAIRYYEKARTISPGWPDPILKLGFCWLNKGENAKAVDAFEKFLKLEKDTKRAAETTKILESLRR